MRPLSLFESGHSNGGVSLTALLEGEAQSGNGKHLDFMEVIKRIVIGGWPELVDAEEDGAIARDTLAIYLSALDRLHLIENSEAWRPHMRSRARLRQAPVRYFVDPSLGLAALNSG